MKTFFNIIFLLLIFSSFAQNIPSTQSDTLLKKDNNLAELILPISLVTYGIIGLESHFLRFYNYEIKEEVGEHIDNKITIDDYSQYAPFTSVYLLNSLGIEGKHNLKDRSLILGSAYLIMGATVLTLKSVVDVTRPDGSSNNSFPSGHTATAFMGAEFLYQEYKDVSIWYGVAGYSVALGTGVLRMINDRHWLTDVSAGAGFGILSTKIAYYIFDKYIQEDRVISKLGFSPYLNDKEVGLSLSFKF